MNEAWLPSCFLAIVKDTEGCVSLNFPFTDVATGLIFFFEQELDFIFFLHSCFIVLLSLSGVAEA